jgi:acyl carrier protein
MDLDSLRLLILIGAIEEEFSLTIDDEEVQLPDFETLGSLVTVVQERLGG